MAEPRLALAVGFELCKLPCEIGQRDWSLGVVMLSLLEESQLGKGLGFRQREPKKPALLTPHGPGSSGG